MLAICAKHLFKFFENVPKTALPPLLPKLLLKALKASKALAEWTLASKRILCLLISCHPGLIINHPLLLITQRFVRVVYMCESLLRLFTLVDIGVVLLGQFKVCGLNFSLGSVSPDPQLIIKIVFCVTNLGCPELPLGQVESPRLATGHNKNLSARLADETLYLAIVVLMGNE